MACMTDENLHSRPFTGGWVWKANTYPKIRCFLWQCLHKSIPVRGVLVARGVNTPTLCPLCNNASESIVHMLRDCSQACLFCDSLGIPIQHDLFYGLNFEAWLRINYASQQKSFSGINGGIVLPFGIWSLWLWRNKVVFRDTSSRRPLKAETLVRVAEFAFLGVNG